VLRGGAWPGEAGQGPVGPPSPDSRTKTFFRRNARPLRERWICPISENDHEPPEALPAALAYWRTRAAESFDDDLRAEVARFVASITSTIPEWRAAACGDAGAAAGLVIKSRIPDRPQSLSAARIFR
jgi:hypothetical protein